MLRLTLVSLVLVSHPISTFAAIYPPEDFTAAKEIFPINL